MSVRSLEGAEIAISRDVVISVMAALAAAISLLERSPKTAAPSDRMFDMMLDDYRRALNDARIALGGSSDAAPAPDPEKDERDARSD